MEKIEKNIYFDDKNNIFRVKLMANGKRFENCFTTLEKAREFKNTTVNKIALDNQRKNKKISDYVAIFLRAKEMENVSPSTMHHYQGVFKALIEEMGNRNLKKMEVYEWHEIFLRMREKNPVSNNTWGKYIDSIAALCNHFGIKFPKRKFKAAKEPSNRRNFTPEEIERFLVVAKANLDSTFFALYYTYFLLGARKNELLALHWDDVNFQEKTVTISRSLQERKGGIVEVPTKTKNSRTIPIGDEDFWTLVQELYNRKTSKYVFENTVKCTRWKTEQQTEHLNPKTVHRNFKRILKEAGLDENLSIHSCRHSFATLSLSKGGSIKDVQKIGGWASSSVILSTYAHAQDETIRKMTGSGSYLTKIL